MTTYSEDHEKLQSDRAENSRQLEEDNVINSFFAKHADEVVNCVASWKAIQSYFDGDAITEYALEESWNNNSGLRKVLATHTPQEDRNKLEASIKELLASGSSPGAATEQAKKFRFKSTEELRLWLKELQGRKEARKRTPDELRQIIRSAAPTAPDELPKSISKQQILYMLSGSDIRELARKYSMAAITKRINEKD
jgi:hypothetical protein